MSTQRWGVVEEADVQIKPMEYMAFDSTLLQERIKSVFAGLVQPAQEPEPEQVEEPEPIIVEEDPIQKLQEEMDAKMAQMRAEAEERVKDAYQRGKLESEAESARKMASVRDAVAGALQHFSAEKEKYFHDVEQQVVRLALTIAAKILHREAQMDPLLLSGAVRVALGQLAETTQVRLRIPAAELALWEEMLRLIPNLPIRPKVIGEENFADGDCVLETEVGSVDLGVRAQLAEIERGFFDLLDQRPGAAPAEGTALAARN
jgi:flagellar assembly protein FliH